VSDEKKGSEDVVALGYTLPNGDIPFVRQRENVIEAGTARIVREGEPLGEAEVVRLEPNEDGLTYRAQPLYDGRKGPTKVNSNAFRNGWDAVFGNKQLN